VSANAIDTPVKPAIAITAKAIFFMFLCFYLQTGIHITLVRIRQLMLKIKKPEQVRLFWHCAKRN
jgi:hypothetical protein